MVLVGGSTAQSLSAHRSPASSSGNQQVDPGFAGPDQAHPGKLLSKFQSGDRCQQ